MDPTRGSRHAATTAAEQGNPGHTRVVLLAPDSAQTLDLLTALLDPSGEPFAVTHFHDLDEGVEAFGDARYDVVLLDLSLMSPPSVAALAKVAVQARRTPIIVLGNSEQEALLLRAVHQGASDYLLLDQLHATTVARTIRFTIERDRVERAREEVESHYRALFDDSVDAILVTSSGGLLRRTNPALSELSGYPENELRGMPAARLFARRADWLRLLRTVRSSGAIKDFEAPLRRKDDAVRECLITATVCRDADGTPVGLQAIARDMTPARRLANDLAEALAREKEARSAAEQAQQEAISTLESITDAFLALDCASRVRFANQAALSFVREKVHAQPDDLLGREIWEVIPELAETRFEAEYRRTLATSAPCRFEEFFSGWGVWLNVQVYPAPGGVAVWFQDITDRKRLEERLRLSQRLEAVGRLTTGIAHDFNNLLTVIRGNAQLLQMELPDGSTAHGDAVEIGGAVTRAASLIEQLLAFSRQRELDMQIVDLNHLVREVVTMLERVLLGTVRIVTRLDPDLGTVEGDPGQLHQVLMNLAVNARDAMPEGGTLTIESANAELTPADTARYPYEVEPGRYVALRVTDTGVGMDQETQSHVFEPFFTTKQRSTGTGLGLSTAYGIVKKSGGYIWVQSEPGKGTTFEVYLPRTG